MKRPKSTGTDDRPREREGDPGDAPLDARAGLGEAASQVEAAGISVARGIPSGVDAWTGPSDEDFWEDTGEDEVDAETAQGGSTRGRAFETHRPRWAADSQSPDYAHLGAGLTHGEPFSLLPSDLALLAALNHFPVGDAGETPILFGLRGCGIVTDHVGSSGEVTLKDDRPDHERPRCVLGVWDRVRDRIFVFPGSTVPNAKAVAGYCQGGSAGNLLPTGLYGYVVGPHITSKRRQGCFLLRKSPNEKRIVAVRRSRDDPVYTTKDIVDVCMPGDNIHPTFFSEPIAFSSFGCQTVVGTADDRGNHSGPWAEFRKAAGLIDGVGELGKPFLYMLLTGAEARLASEMRRAERLSDTTSRNRLRRLRFGSRGEAVRKLQVGLGVARPDGEFGRVTAERLHAHQRHVIDGSGSDGVLTPAVDKALAWSVFDSMVA